MFTLIFLANPADAEMHEGEYGVFGRDSTGNNVAVVFSVGSTGAGIAPSGTEVETVCGSPSFSWPRVISTSPVVTSDWLFLPVKDTYGGSTNCAAGTPGWLAGSTKNTFNVALCTNGTNCPAVVGAGPWTDQVNANPILSLQPGLYHVTAHQTVGGTASTGNADVFVRPTANGNGKVRHLETWCYDGTFHWPRVKQTHGGTQYDQVSWQYKVDGVNSAPAAVTCPGGTTRVDYNYIVN